MPKVKYPIFKFLHRGQKGFTLIELLVVIAILGIIAAIIVPNITKFIGEGVKEAAITETHNVQLAVTAAMADAKTASVAEPGSFGNTGHEPEAPFTGTTMLVYTIGTTTYHVGDYILNGAAAVKGEYEVGVAGNVSMTWYPGL